MVDDVFFETDVTGVCSFIISVQGRLARSRIESDVAVRIQAAAENRQVENRRTASHARPLPETDRPLPGHGLDSETQPAYQEREHRKEF